jgi:hypothetical protein
LISIKKATFYPVRSARKKQSTLLFAMGEQDAGIDIMTGIATEIHTM